MYFDNSSQAPPLIPSLALLQRAAQSFDTEPDSAGIHQGVRRMRQGVPHTRIVLVPSIKNEGTTACEGRLEAALAKSLEIDPSVARYRGQPFFLRGPKGRDVVCDFAILLANGLYMIVDVKPSGRLESRSVIERMHCVRTALADSFLPHRIVTEIELEREPARQIREQLWKGVNAPMTSYQCEQLLTVIRRGPITVAELRELGGAIGLPPYAVEKLAVLNLISFDIDAPWGAKTLIGDRYANHTSAAAAWGSVQDVVVPL